MENSKSFVKISSFFAFSPSHIECLLLILVRFMGWECRDTMATKKERKYEKSKFFCTYQDSLQRVNSRSETLSSSSSKASISSHFFRRRDSRADNEEMARGVLQLIVKRRRLSSSSKVCRRMRWCVPVRSLDFSSTRMCLLILIHFYYTSMY